MKSNVEILDNSLAINAMETKRTVRDDSLKYQNLINLHLDFIEKQCYNAIYRKLHDAASESDSLNIENEALELNNLVLDTLRKDNFRTLRLFQGKAKLTTYLTAVISRLAVDLIRKKLGRSRHKERAQKLGEVGMILYQQVIRDGASIRDTFKYLRENHHYKGTADDLKRMVAEIKGPGPPPAPQGNGHNGCAVKNGISLAEDKVIIPDKSGNPGELFLENERQGEIRRVLKRIIGQLSGEERMLLKMRFPVAENENSVSVREVAVILGISEKAVYKRVDRLQQKCRKKLEAEGVNIDDLL